MYIRWWCKRPPLCKKKNFFFPFIFFCLHLGLSKCRIFIVIYKFVFIPMLEKLKIHSVCQNVWITKAKDFGSIVKNIRSCSVSIINRSRYVPSSLGWKNRVLGLGLRGIIKNLRSWSVWILSCSRYASRSVCDKHYLDWKNRIIGFGLRAIIKNLRAWSVWILNRSKYTPPSVCD